MNNLDGIKARTEVQAPVQKQVDVKIERSAIPPSNTFSSTLSINIENMICKPKEILSLDAIEMRKKINSRFELSDNFSDFINALHYLHVTFLEVEKTSESIKIPEIENGKKAMKDMLYRAAGVFVSMAEARNYGISSDYTFIQKAVNDISKFRGICSDENVDIILMKRFSKLKDKNTRIAGLKGSLLQSLDEIQKTFRYIMERFDLPSDDFFWEIECSGSKGDVRQEFFSYLSCMQSIIKIGCNPALYTAEGACKPSMMDALFKQSQIFADLKNVNKKNLVELCASSVNKEREILNIISECDEKRVVAYHYVLVHMLVSINIFVDTLLITKFHISEIASIELEWIFEELQSFDSENSYAKITNALAKPIDCFKGSSKLSKMLTKMNHLTRVIDKEEDGNLLNLLQRFMDSGKTIELWCDVKSKFDAFRNEVTEIKRSMAECNAELQKMIDQTKWESQEEIDQIKHEIEVFKSILSPFLFVAFKLPGTLDDFVVEGKDGLFKQPKAKTLQHDTQMNIKDLLKVNFPKIEVIQPIEVVQVVEEVQPVIVVPTKKSEPVKKQPQKVKPEPKVFQTNKVNDILAELKDRGWIKDRYHGSHLIFKKDRETFTVPTNHSRVKDGLLSGLNRQIVEKEVRINHNGHNQ